MKGTTAAALALTALIAGTCRAAQAASMNGNPEAIAASAKILRGEVARDRGDLVGKRRNERAERRELRAQMRAELARVRGTKGTRAEKKEARKTVLAKYAKLLQAAHEKGVFERNNLRHDLSTKRAQIQRLRQS